MGLSANQAKLLSITARLSDNELRAQFITNTKMRNADAQSEATGEYMRALDSHDLNYSFYDADNLRTTMKLTPQAMLAFGENKVQYGLVNNAGQLLASSLDIANFQKSNTLEQFLDCYGVLKKENPVYAEQLQYIYGDNYDKFFDISNKYGIFNEVDGKADEFFGSVANFDTDAGKWVVTSQLSTTAQYNAVVGMNANTNSWYNGFAAKYEGIAGDMGQMAGSVKFENDNDFSKVLGDKSREELVRLDNEAKAKILPFAANPGTAPASPIEPNPPTQTIYTDRPTNYNLALKGAAEPKRSDSVYQLPRAVGYKTSSAGTVANGGLVYEQGPLNAARMLTALGLGSTPTMKDLLTRVYNRKSMTPEYNYYNSQSNLFDASGNLKQGLKICDYSTAYNTSIANRDGVYYSELVSDLVKSYGTITQRDASGNVVDINQIHTNWNNGFYANEEIYKSALAAAQDSVAYSTGTLSTLQIQNNLASIISAIDGYSGAGIADTRVNNGTYWIPGEADGTVSQADHKAYWNRVAEINEKVHSKDHVTAKIDEWNAKPENVNRQMDQDMIDAVLKNQLRFIGTGNTGEFARLNPDGSTGESFGSEKSQIIADMLNTTTWIGGTTRQETFDSYKHQASHMTYKNAFSDANGRLFSSAFVDETVEVDGKNPLTNHPWLWSENTIDVNGSSYKYYSKTVTPAAYYYNGETKSENQVQSWVAADVAEWQRWNQPPDGYWPKMVEYAALDTQFQKDLTKYTTDLDKFNAYEESLRTYERNGTAQAIEAFDAQWTNTINVFQTWIDAYQPKKIQVAGLLGETFSPLIADEKDPKVEWYTNMWYRMGAESADIKDNAVAARHYAQLDDKYMDNAAWIQWGLETGTLAMEQVIFNEKGSEKHPNLKEREWKSIGYKNSSDVREEQDKRELTRAEVKYEKTVRELQAHDKQLDNDLKRLDTQHNALQQEYEMLKGVTDKNIERSFKAFS